MNEKEILEKIKASVFDLLKHESTGHDYFHIQRVVNNTKKICENENCNSFYALQLAYLHDVGDYKIHNGIDKTEEIVSQILSPLNYTSDKIETIINDIHLIGYKDGFNKKTDKIEVLIVQDADRLDALGAIGIARAFAYGGKKGRLLHNPDFDASEFKTAEDYKNSNAPTIQHFYDKLLKLKDLMNTQTGKQLAIERHTFMETYLETFYKEWGVI